MKTLLVCSVALGVLLAAPAMAQWVEQGDAGDLPATAQVPTGTGPLTTITGDLPAGDVDMYCISITDPTMLNAETCSGTSFDTQLFLFRADGLGVGMNDDACSLQSRITSTTMSCPNAVGPGDYFIAVSKYNRDPVDAQQQLLWLSGTQEHCADGAGAANPIAGWTGTTTVGGAYVITMRSVTYCGVTSVEPATWGNIKSLYR
jgi:hypothetical protein